MSNMGYEKWMLKKSEWLEEIENLDNQLSAIKQKLKGTEKHIPFDDLEEADKIRIPPAKRGVF